MKKIIFLTLKNLFSIFIDYLAINIILPVVAYIIFIEFNIALAF